MHLLVGVADDPAIVVVDLAVSFSPAVSDDAAKTIRQAIKHWRLHRWSEATLVDLARSINVIVHG